MKYFNHIRPWNPPMTKSDTKSPDELILSRQISSNHEEWLDLRTQNQKKKIYIDAGVADRRWWMTRTPLMEFFLLSRTLHNRVGCNYKSNYRRKLGPASLNRLSIFSLGAKFSPVEFNENQMKYQYIQICSDRSVD